MGITCGAAPDSLLISQVSQTINFIKAGKLICLLHSLHPPTITGKHGMLTVFLVNSESLICSPIARQVGIPESCFLFVCLHSGH